VKLHGLGIGVHVDAVLTSVPDSLTKTLNESRSTKMGTTMSKVPTLRVASKDRAPQLPDLSEEVRLVLSEAAVSAREGLARDERGHRPEGDVRDDAGRDHRPGRAER
jgi:hypothetical protein